MKIVFLGDSLTNGSYGGDWVAVVAQQLPKHEVINEGVGGDTVVNLAARLEKVLQKHSPDAVFVMVGGNDVVSHIFPDTRLYYKSSKKIAPDGIVAPERFATTYRELLTYLLLERVQPFVGLASTEYNAELVQERQRYNRLTREIAAGLAIPVCDLETPFLPTQPVQREPVTMKFIQEIGKRQSEGWHDFEVERAKYGYTYTFDGMHLMAETAPKFAALVVAFLKKHGF
jgi:lysophospholipase L1-like esterase